MAGSGKMRGLEFCVENLKDFLKGDEAFGGGDSA